jgi:hypothetical protein
VLLVLVTMISGVGWWGDYFNDNPLVYRDLESIRAVTTTPPR